MIFFPKYYSSLNEICGAFIYFLFLPLCVRRRGYRESRWRSIVEYCLKACTLISFPATDYRSLFFLHITHDWIASLTLLIYQPLSFYLFCHFSFLLFLYTGETIVEDRNHIRTWVHPPFSRGLVHIHIFMKRVSQSNVLIDFAMGNNLRTEIKRKVFFQLFLLFVRTTFVFLSCDTNRIFEIFLF